MKKNYFLGFDLNSGADSVVLIFTMILVAIVIFCLVMLGTAIF